MYIMMGVFSCVMDRTKIKRTNQLEIVQNEIWTPRKFPAIRQLPGWTVLFPGPNNLSSDRFQHHMRDTGSDVCLAVWVWERD